MAWTNRFKAPSGIPAGHFSAGPGWGGPARGARRGGPASPFRPGNVNRVSFHTGQCCPERAEKRRALSAAKEARTEQLIDHPFDLARNAEHEGTRLSATVAALNRLDGYPLVKTKHQNNGPSLEELIRATQQPKSGSSSRVGSGQRSGLTVQDTSNRAAYCVCMGECT
jgi:hypothetical protein